jgi:hypothetical protein
MEANAPRPEHASLLAEIDAFLHDRGMAQSTFSRNAMGDPLFVADVRKGRQLFVGTEAKVRAYMEKYRTPGAGYGLAARSGGGVASPPEQPRRRQSPA